MPIRLLNTDRTTIDPILSSALGKGTKPDEGIWYGLGDDWLNWSTRQMPKKLQPNLFELELDETRILKLSTLAECRSFAAEYGEQGSHMYDIDWDRVGKRWADIEVTPECTDEYYELTCTAARERKLEWLFPWDVASGCVWDSSAIRGSKKIPETDSRVVKLHSQMTLSRP